MTRGRAWLLAARPATLLAVVAPVLVGSGLAAGAGVFRGDAFTVAMISALLLNTGVNFANDASDAGRGADTGSRIGPRRAVASGWITPRAMWAGVAAAFSLAAAGGIYLAFIAGWPVLAIGAAAILAALGYTGGPAPYGYRGWGEVAVFIFFGVAATVGSRFVHDSTAPLDAWLLAVPVGMTAAAILVANNVRDLETDRAAGKRTLAVILGRRLARALYGLLVLGGFPLIAWFSLAGWTPLGAVIAVAAAPLAAVPLRTVARETAGPALIGALKATALLHALTGALLAAGSAL